MVVPRGIRPGDAGLIHCQPEPTSEHNEEILDAQRLSPSPPEIGGHVPPGFDFHTLPPFLRVLLATDGTVTKSLEAYFWERVDVQVLEQGLVTLDAAVPAIDRQSGETVVRRSVVLRGRKSGREYVTAESLICFDLLSRNFQDDLHNRRLGVGELLLACGLETYREILELGGDPKTEVWRRYRIVMEHRPFIQITERFPSALYR